MDPGKLVAQSYLIRYGVPGTRLSFRHVPARRDHPDRQGHSGLAILAAVTALFAVGGFGIQYFQLRDQLTGRKREGQERHSAQAVQVYVTFLTQPCSGSAPG